MLSSKPSTEERLNLELRRLQQTLGLGSELNARWIPNGNKELSGEVKHDIIFIYEEDEEKALETLKHEFFDYAISQIIEPYKQVTNRLISLINEDAYRKKEKLVNRVSKLL